MTTRAIITSDHSISSLGASSGTLIAKDMTRVFLHIFNSGADNVGVNLTGGTAAIGAAGTSTIVPNGSITFNQGSIIGNPVTVIGTQGQPVTCVTSP